jgi:hypothetical protein
VIVDGWFQRLNVRVDYVEHPWKRGVRRDLDRSVRRLVIGIWVEDSARRIDGVAPGPGGAGYELDRRFGEAVHYLRIPSRGIGELLLAELEREGRIGRVWGGGTSDLWFVTIWTSEVAAGAEIAGLDELARAAGGAYDGGEVIDGLVWGPDGSREAPT